VGWERSCNVERETPSTSSTARNARREPRRGVEAFELDRAAVLRVTTAREPCTPHEGRRTAERERDVTGDHSRAVPQDALAQLVAVVRGPDCEAPTSQM
jgi:hypothetical protein